jgi:glutamate-1-semialdehyde 2,1-aminomutase
MDHLAPEGPVYQAGTLSGNPVAVAVGLATLDLIDREVPHPGLDASAEQLATGVSDVLTQRGIEHTINREGSLFSPFLGDRAVTDYDSAKHADHKRFARLFQGMLVEGVYLPPSGYEGWFLGAAHGPEELERTVEAVRAVTSRW